MSLEKLEQLVTRLKQLQGDDMDVLRARLELLNEELPKIIHRLRFMTSFELELAKMRPGKSQVGWKEEEEKHVKPVGKLAFYEDLSKFKPPKNRREREDIALQICEALFRVEAKVKQYLQCRGFDTEENQWPMWLVGLYNRYGNMKLQDFSDPAIPSQQNFQNLPSEYRSEWLKGVDEGRFEYFAVLGHEVLQDAESECKKEWWERNHSIRPLSDILNELVPPLTWGEIVFHYISDLTESGDTEKLKELDPFFSAKRHCIDCGGVFEVDKYNPGRFRCKTCSLRARVQRYRAKKRQRPNTA